MTLLWPTRSRTRRTSLVVPLPCLDLRSVWKSKRCGLRLLRCIRSRRSANWVSDKTSNDWASPNAIGIIATQFKTSANSVKLHQEAFMQWLQAHSGDLCIYGPPSAHVPFSSSPQSKLAIWIGSFTDTSPMWVLRYRELYNTDAVSRSSSTSVSSISPQAWGA